MTLLPRIVSAMGLEPGPIAMNKARKVLEAVQAWQPIETAPKDGTAILGAIAGSRFNNGPTIGAIRFTVEGPHYFGWWGVAANSVCIRNPTHWQPLPALPEE